MTDLPQTGPPFVEVGRYARRRQADERALVVSAMGCTWKLEQEADGCYVLFVYERHHDAVARELEKFEAENAGREKIPKPSPSAKISPVSLFVAGWVMCGFFFVQNFGSMRCEDAGTASSEAICRGEWWLAVTALTLHADFGHIAANLITGLLFAAFVLPSLGSGWTWTLILASGAAGNLLTAWSYRDTSHLSIGASTAVFGALGILTATQTLDALRSTRTVRLWEVILPLGAGIALLAYLGTGGEHTDMLAHLWGFATGGCLGIAAALLELKKRTPQLLQRGLCGIAPLMLALCWILAMRH